MRSPVFEVLPEKKPGAGSGEIKWGIFTTSWAGLEPVILLFSVPQHRMDLASDSRVCIYVDLSDFGVSQRWLMKSVILWDVTLWSPVDINFSNVRFDSIFRSKNKLNKHADMPVVLFAFIFTPEDGVHTILL
jgi:hypothetical protein